MEQLSARSNVRDRRESNTATSSTSDSRTNWNIWCLSVSVFLYDKNAKENARGHVSKPGEPETKNLISFPSRKKKLRTSGGGGPSIDNDTIFSPRSSSKPNVRFCIFSSFPFPLPPTLLYSSASAMMRFMCLSKAIN